MRRIAFTPARRISLYHTTWWRAATWKSANTRPGRAGIRRPGRDPGAYDRENLPGAQGIRALAEPGRRHGDGLPGATRPGGRARDRAAKRRCAPRWARHAHGYEVGYESFAINGRMLGHGEPLRVKAGERVLLHVLNGAPPRSAAWPCPATDFRWWRSTKTRSPSQAVPVLWLGTAERVSAIVEMRHPAAWILGDLADDDRKTAWAP